MQITQLQLDKALASGDLELIVLARKFLATTDQPFYSWKPRPDQPKQFDEQTSFVGDWESRIQVCLGGTGSGKSDAAAFKAAKFLLERQPPPRKNTPFWVLSSTLDMSCGVLWESTLWIRPLPELLRSDTLKVRTDAASRTSHAF